MIHAHIIHNPAAGRGRAARVGDGVARAFRTHGWTVELRRTTQPGDGVRLAHEAAAAGVRQVVVVGGDGTVHEVANGLLGTGSDAALGVVPIGSGDDFAKLVGTWGCEPDRAVARVVTASRRRFDVGYAADEYFVNSLGIGFGAAVVQTRNAMPGLRGFLSYLVPVVRTFARFAAPHLEVEAAEHREAGRMMMVEVCNGTTAGGSYRFAPEADPTDGRLNVCLIRDVSLPRFLLALPRVMRGTHTTMREFAVFTTARVVLRSAGAPIVAHLDGELRETGCASLTVELLSARLTVLVAA